MSSEHETNDNKSESVILKFTSDATNQAYQENTLDYTENHIQKKYVVFILICEFLTLLVYTFALAFTNTSQQNYSSTTRLFILIVSVLSVILTKPIFGFILFIIVHRVKNDRIEKYFNLIGITLWILETILMIFLLHIFIRHNNMKDFFIFNLVFLIGIIVITLIKLLFNEEKVQINPLYKLKTTIIWFGTIFILIILCFSYFSSSPTLFLFSLVTIYGYSTLILVLIQTSLKYIKHNDNVVLMYMMLHCGLYGIKKLNRTCTTDTIIQQYKTIEEESTKD
jgi:hypothetical protein